MFEFALTHRHVGFLNTNLSIWKCLSCGFAFMKTGQAKLSASEKAQEEALQKVHQLEEERIKLQKDLEDGLFLPGH